MNDAQKITIDGREYNTADLSDKVKNELISLRAAEQELARIQTQLALVQTARNAYAASIRNELEGGEQS